MSVSLLLCFFFLGLILHLASPVSIDQMIPKNNLPVCANATLEYICRSFTGNLLVQEGDETQSFSTSSSLNKPFVVGSFEVQLVKVDGDSLTAMAASMFTDSSCQSKRLVVYDGNTFFAKDVTVAGGPDSCQGIVSCSVIPIAENSQFSNLTISLDSSQSASRCIDGYNFTLGVDSQLTPSNPAIATFSFDRSRGQPYLNQKIYPLDGEGRQGEYSCSFNITAPNPVTVSSKAESCDGSMIKVTIIFDIPTFPPENCLDIHTVKLNYHITSSNGVLDEPIDTLNNIVEILVDQQTEFVLSITPTLPDLGISGALYTTAVVITTQCSVSPSALSSGNACQNSSIVIGGGVLLGTLTFVLVIVGLLFIFYICKTRRCKSPDGVILTGTGMNQQESCTEQKGTHLRDGNKHTSEMTNEANSSNMKHLAGGSSSSSESRSYSRSESRGSSSSSESRGSSSSSESTTGSCAPLLEKQYSRV